MCSFDDDDDIDMDLSLSLDSFESMYENSCNRTRSVTNESENKQPSKENFIQTSVNSNRNSAEPPSKLVYERKFPGPAGLFPKRQHNSSASCIIDNEKHSELHSNSICSQKSDLILDNAPWQYLYSKVYEHSKEARAMLDKFKISYLKNLTVISRSKSCKIPLFVAMVHYLDCTIVDPAVVLKDNSGEIHGTLHRDIWENYKTCLTVGSILLLRNVGILHLYNSQHLNITVNNLVSIYPSTSAGAENECAKEVEISDFPTDQDVLNLQKQWITFLCNAESQDNKSKSLPDSPNNSLFTSYSPKVSPPKKTTDLVKTPAHSNFKTNMNSGTVVSSSRRSDSVGGTSSGSKNSTPKFVQKKGQFCNYAQSVIPDKSKDECHNQDSSKSVFSILGDADSNDVSVVSNIFEGIDADCIFDDF